jgi:uncharacterized protein (DUF885 family)
MRLTSLAALLLASAGTQVALAQQAAPPAPAATGQSAEDARLTAFLDAAFDAQTELNPQQLTQLGIKRHYDRLNDYTEAHRQRVQALEERQLADMRAQFRPERLSPAGRLSYRLFEEEVQRDQAGVRWRWHNFPASTNGSPMGNIPVFLINAHRVDNVADAEAYVARLRDVERTRGGSCKARPSPTGPTAPCSPTSRRR